MSQGEAFSRVKIDAQLEGRRLEPDRRPQRALRVPARRSARAPTTCSATGRAARLRCWRPSAPASTRSRPSGRPRPTPKPSTCRSSSSPTAKRSGSGTWTATPISRPVETVFSQDDLERRAARRTLRRDPLDVADRQPDRRPRLSARLHRHALPRDRAGPAQAAGRDGDRHRQDADGRRPDQAAVRRELDHARAVPGRPQHAGQADRGRLRRAPADAPVLPRAAHGRALPGRRSGSRSPRCRR